MEADLVTLRGRQHQHVREGECVLVPSGSIKIVACSHRSELDELAGGLVLPGEHLELGRPRRSACWATSRSLAFNQRKRLTNAGRSQTRPYYSATVVPITWGRGGQRSKASKALTSGKECSRNPVSSSLLASGSTSGTVYGTLVPSARFSEEPGAGKPHAGICEGGAR